jgi:alpha-L-fucosidase
MKKILVFLAVVCSILHPICAQQIPVPNKAQVRWHKYERTMFLCLDPCTWQAREYDNHTTPLGQINPSALNTDQWCEVAQSWGAKMILFVAKHTGGFCWWGTKSVEYNIMNTPYNKDVLAQLSASCKKYGLDLGIYVYPGDEAFGSPIGSGGITADPSLQKAQNKAFRIQMEEVLSNYGPIREIWFDGGCKIDIDDIVEKHRETAVIFQGKYATLRWSGNEEGIAPYPNWYTLSSDVVSENPTALHSDPDGDAYSPLEMNVTFFNNHGHKWFWAPNTDHMVLELEQLINLYYKSVGRGSTFLLNCTPDTTGLIPDLHVERYREFGDATRALFDSPLASTKGKGKLVQLDLGKETTFNQFVLQERIEDGQRIRSYILEASSDGKEWKEVTRGESVGHKRIELFDPYTARYVRIRFPIYKMEPIISNFSLYNVDRKAEKIETENTFISIGKWDRNTFSPDKWIDLEIDLTKYVNEVGIYEIVFHTFAHDLSQKSGLQFKDWIVNIYGRDDTNLITYDKGRFYITRSQQTLDDFKTSFKVRVKSEKGLTLGDIQMRKIKHK